MEIVDKNTNQTIKEIAEHYNLDLVVLFGSHSKDRATKESDIDIGIFRKTSGVTFEDQIALSGKFSELFKNNDIDIGVISSNNPILMFSILKYGKVLYTTENRLVDTLRLYAWKLVAESKSFRDHSFFILKNRIASLN